MARLSEMGALRIADPAMFELRLRRVMAESGGRLGVAARALGVSGRQLSRWLSEYPDVPRAEPGRPWSARRT